MKALEELLHENEADAPVKGEWFNIRWIPDFSTGERLNVGVGFISEGRVYTRLLNYFERIKCLYSSDAIYHIQFLSDIIKECTDNNIFESPTSQIIYDQKGYAQGASIDEVLSNLFDQTITLARKVREPKKRAFASISNDKLYTCLIDELKTIAGLSYESFVPENPSLIIDDGNSKHNLYIPFRNNNETLGGLASTVYSNAMTIELNLLIAARDVETALKLNKGKNAYVFILKPSDELNNLPEEQVNLIETKLDKFDWYMGKQEIKVSSHVTIPGLAEEIYNWSRVA